jgi:HicB family
MTSRFDIAVTLRLPRELHMRVQTAARAARLSLNQWLLDRIEEKTRAIEQVPVTPSAEPPVIVSRCGRADCAAAYWSDRSFSNSCGNACAFSNRMTCAGEPPFMPAADVVAEIENLLLRRSVTG